MANRSARDSIEEEFKRYMLESQTNWRVNDVMQWWSDHEANFPRIALLALKYLAIPASSAPSERVFSHLKFVIERKRWRMDAGRVERVINRKLFAERAISVGRPS